MNCVESTTRAAAAGKAVRAAVVGGDDRGRGLELHAAATPPSSGIAAAAKPPFKTVRRLCVAGAGRSGSVAPVTALDRFSTLC